MLLLNTVWAAVLIRLLVLSAVLFHFGDDFGLRFDRSIRESRVSCASHTLPFWTAGFE